MARMIGRNEPCHCGSGLKYKKCCLAKDEEHARTATAAGGVPFTVAEDDSGWEEDDLGGPQLTPYQLAMICVVDDVRGR